MKHKSDNFYIFGKKPIEEQLLKNPENIMRIFISDFLIKHEAASAQIIRDHAKEHHIPVSSISKNNIKKYVGDVNTQGVIALVKKHHFYTFDEWEEEVYARKKDLGEKQAVLILDGVQDTHNYGAILRSAAAVGVSAVFVPKDRQAPVNGTVFKTSAGAILRVPIVQVANINQSILKLQKMRFWVAAVDMEREEKESQSLFTQNLDDNMAFVLGSEGKGISEKTREHSDFILFIPMENGVESLNVSVAAAVVLYEWKRQIVNVSKNESK